MHVVFVKLEAGHYVTADRRFRITKQHSRSWDQGFCWQITDRTSEPFMNPYGESRSRFQNERTLGDARHTIAILYAREEALKES